MALTLLFTIACAAYSVPGVQRYSGDVKCVSDGFNPEVKTTSYTCYCPMDPSYTNLFDITEEDFADPGRLRINACYEYTLHNPVIPALLDTSATATPTLVPTATSTPTKRPTATPAPYLSGDVTTCNLTDRYINFPIDPNAADISGLDFEVTIGGVPSTCNVPSSNTNILSCTFSQGQTFPAQVIVSVDGFITNDFTFDGGICVTNPIPQDNSGSGNDPVLPVEPSPTTDPNSNG